MAADWAHSKWFFLLGSVVLLYKAVTGIVTGRTTFYADYTRSDDAYMYWLIVLLSAGLGIVALVFWVK